MRPGELDRWTPGDPDARKQLDLLLFFAFFGAMLLSVSGWALDGHDSAEERSTERERNPRACAWHRSWAVHVPRTFCCLVFVVCFPPVLILGVTLRLVVVYILLGNGYSHPGRFSV